MSLCVSPLSKSLCDFAITDALSDSLVTTICETHLPYLDRQDQIAFLYDAIRVITIFIFSGSAEENARKINLFVHADLLADLDLV